MSEQLLHLHLGLYLHPLEIVDLCGSERNLSGGSWVLEELLSFSLSRVDAPAAEKIAKVHN
uniref:Uncharacterized protein n=1 Tax=Rhizophora mucronata TaxID=61149 RepID=A0A2P2IHE6_RHIMU